MKYSTPRRWVVVERRASGWIVRRSKRLNGVQADQLVARLRAHGRDAFALRFRFPAHNEIPSTIARRGAVPRTS